MEPEAGTTGRPKSAICTRSDSVKPSLGRNICATRESSQALFSFSLSFESRVSGVNSDGRLLVRRARLAAEEDRRPESGNRDHSIDDKKIEFDFAVLNSYVNS